MIEEMPQRWTLPAPESQVLLTGPETPNNWAIKLALKELVLRRVLSVRTVEERRFWVLRRQVSILIPGTHRNDPVSQPLQAVLDVLPQNTVYQDHIHGVPIRSAAIEVIRWYRAGGGYVEAEVLPELRRQGLYDLYPDAGGSRWRLTPKGEGALVQVRELMATGRESFPTWVESDRDRATDFVRMAGPAVLLLGSPVPWIWILTMETLSGDESMALPWADPLAEPLPRDLESATASGGSWTVEVGSADGDPLPGELIDREVDAATDDGGDGEGGDGE
jgi:hypothetical protein